MVTAREAGNPEFSSRICGGQASLFRVEDNQIERHDDEAVDIQATVAVNHLKVRDNDILNNNQADNNARVINVRIDGVELAHFFIEDNDIISDATPKHRYAVFFNESAAGTYK